MELFARNEDVLALEAKLGSLEDGARLHTLIALAWQLRQRDCKRAVVLVDEAEILLRKLATDSVEFQRGMARLGLVRGEVDWLYVDFAAAQAHAAAAKSLFKQVGDLIGEGDAASLLASIWSARGSAKNRDEFLLAASQAYQSGDDVIRQQACTARILHYAAFRDANAVVARLATLSTEATSSHPCITSWTASARAVVAGLHGDFGGSIKYFFEAHRAAQECGHLQQAIMTATNAADCFASLGDLDTALEWDERASSLAQQTAWPAAIGIAMLQTGNVLRLLDRHEAAKSTLCDALNALAALPNASSYSITLQYLGELSLDMGDPAAALRYFQQSEHSAQLLADSNLVVRCWRGQANALSRLGNSQAAIEKIDSALELATQRGTPGEKIKVLRVYAELCQQHDVAPPVGMTAPSAALHYLGQAMAVATSIEGYAMPGELLDEIAGAHASSGDYREAYASGKAAARARDSKQLSDARNRVLAMQVRQETDRLRAEGELLRQQAQIEAQRATALQDSNATLEALGVFGREVTACLNADAVVSTLARHVHRLLDLTSFHVYLLSDNGRFLNGMAVVPHGELMPADCVAIEDPLSTVARCARNLHQIAYGGFSDESELCDPLLIGERLMGVMVVRSNRSRAYGEREQRVFKTLCAYVAVALDNAVAYRKLEAALQMLRETQSRLEEVSTTDPLTGLRNRRFLMQHIETDIAICLRGYDQQSIRLPAQAIPDTDLIFFMVDIDYFKAVNDTYGHACGDMVLVEFRQRLVDVFRESDYLVRWGGEEFLLIARASNRADATIVAERIRQAISSRPFELTNGVVLKKTCSVGFCSFPFLPQQPRLLTWEQVVELADHALYLAKHGGRNGWVGVLNGNGTTPMDSSFQALIQDLNQAVRMGELKLAVSPNLKLDGS